MDAYIPTAEAAELAQLSQTHIRHLTRTGAVESKKFSNITMVSRASLMAYLKTDRRPGRKKEGDRRKK